MNFKQSIKSIAVACSLAAASVAANAAGIVFNQVGDTATLEFESGITNTNNQVNPGNLATLKATVDFTVFSLSSTSAVFDVVVKNLSSNSMASVGGNFLYAVGISFVTPKLSGSSDDSAAWKTTVVPTTFGGFEDDLQFCFFANANSNCASASSGVGLAMGGTSTFQLTLSTASPNSFLPSGLSFGSPYVIGFKNIGGTTNATQFESNPIPEPSSIALTGLMLVGLAGARRAIRKNA